MENGVQVTQEDRERFQEEHAELLHLINSAVDKFAFELNPAFNLLLLQHVTGRIRQANANIKMQLMTAGTTVAH